MDLQISIFLWGCQIEVFKNEAFIVGDIDKVKSFNLIDYLIAEGFIEAGNYHVFVAKPGCKIFKFK